MKVNERVLEPIMPIEPSAEGRSPLPVRRETAPATVSISSAARELESAQQKIAAQEDIREDKVREARQAIADGQLDRGGALEVALDRLMFDII